MQIQANGLELCCEVMGDDRGEPLLLIAGIKLQLSSWDPVLVRSLVDAGFRVVTFDQRDVGYSTWVADPAPDLGAVLSGDTSGVNYTLWDMARDTVALLDALGIDSAHVVGHSMGGMVAQCLAISHPQRVRTLTLWATNPGDGTGQSSPEFLARVLRPPPDEPEDAIEEMAIAHRDQVVHPQPVGLEEMRAYARAQLTRAPNPDAQHAIAVVATGDRSDQLRGMAVPTLVLHGDGDQAIAPDGGERLAELIPGSRFVLIEGMGHRPAGPNVERVVAEIVRHARAAG